jgi:hypothetical protein
MILPLFTWWLREPQSPNTDQPPTNSYPEVLEGYSWKCNFNFRVMVASRASATGFPVP